MAITDYFKLEDAEKKLRKVIKQNQGHPLVVASATETLFIIGQRKSEIQNKLLINLAKKDDFKHE